MGNVTTQQGGVEEIEFLARSANRIQLLAAIQNEGTIEKRTLQTQFDSARTTLSRNLETLEERGWIKEVSLGTYSLTCAGEMVVEDFTDLMETVHVTTRFQPFVKWIPEEAFDLDLRLLADADLILADPNNPYAPVNRHIDALKATTTFRGLLPVVGQHAAETGWQRIREDQVEHETVVSPGSAEVLQANPSYKKTIEKMIATDRAQIFISDCDIPYFVGVYDDYVQIGVEDGEGMPRAMVETDSEDVREWAIRTYNEYRQQATPLAIPEEQSDV